MNKREAVAGWLHMAIGAIFLITVIALWLLAAELAPLFKGSFVPDLFAMFGKPIAIAVICIAGLEVAAAIALVRRHTWARAVLIVYSLLLLLVFPIGTAVGAFTLWALLSKPAGPVGASVLPGPPAAAPLLPGP